MDCPSCTSSALSHFGNNWQSHPWTEVMILTVCRGYQGQTKVVVFPSTHGFGGGFGQCKKNEAGRVPGWFLPGTSRPPLQSQSQSPSPRRETWLEVDRNFLGYVHISDLARAPKRPRGAEVLEASEVQRGGLKVPLKGKHMPCRTPERGSMCVDGRVLLLCGLNLY